MKAFVRKITKPCTETVGPKTEVDDLTSVALVFQWVFGQQILDPNWSWKRDYKPYIFSLLLFIYVIFGTLNILRETSDAELCSEAYYTLIMIALLPIKLALFINNKEIFRDLYIKVKTTLLVAIKEDPDSEKVLAKAKKIVIVLFAMVAIPVANQESLAIWNYVNGTPVPLSRTTNILMPMHFPFYEIAWILHSIFLFEIASTTVVLDMWFVLLIFFYCAASDSLEKSLDVEKRRESESETEYADRLRCSLRAFYRAHVPQTKFLNTMNRMYKWLALVPLCNAAMCTCIILLLLSKDLNWKFAPHFLPMFVEIFAYNYFGEQIKTKATYISRALLNFDWTSLQTKDWKCYYIIITYMRKEFCIKTAAVGDLSLITMTTVLKVTYRAFTMLQSVND